MKWPSPSKAADILLLVLSILLPLVVVIVSVVMNIVELREMVR